MKQTILHITSGDSSGSLIEKSNIPGEVFVWHDIMYDGPRNPGWPTNETLEARARFLENETARGLKKDEILNTLEKQYQKIKTISDNQKIVLWFDACLFCQSMLVHILTCLNHCRVSDVDLLCLNAFPGISPFNGLGQMSPDQLASVYDQRTKVTTEQFEYAVRVDKAFAQQDMSVFHILSEDKNTPLPWIPKAIQRWLQEQSNPETGLGRLETLALEAINNGCHTPQKIFQSVARADTPPQYWGDTMLWAKINGLADRTPPLVAITGPNPRLPQFISDIGLNRFKIEMTDHTIL